MCFVLKELDYEKKIFRQSGTLRTSSDIIERFFSNLTVYSDHGLPW